MQIQEARDPTTPFGNQSPMQVVEVTVGDFWRWAYSDLLANTTRGVLAEFVVGHLINAIGTARGPWEAHDLKTPDGITVEVKSSAYWQSWFQEKPSRISFSVSEARAWDPSTNLLADKRARNSDVYVFSVLSSPDGSKPDPVNFDEWAFYVLPSRVVNERLGQQRTASLTTIARLAGHRVPASELAESVRVAAGNEGSATSSPSISARP